MGKHHFFLYPNHEDIAHVEYPDLGSTSYGVGTTINKSSNYGSSEAPAVTAGSLEPRHHKKKSKVGDFFKGAGKVLGKGVHFANKELDRFNPLTFLKDNPVLSALLIGGVVVGGIVVIQVIRK